MNKLLKITTVFGLFLFGTYSNAQCVVDVTIVEGASIEMCEDDPVTISGSNGFVSYGWTGPETLTGQTITPAFSGQYVIAAVDGVGCVSTDTILVTINANPIPTIVSSEGNPLCPGGSTTLSLADPYISYDWGGGNTASTSFASGPGAYAVTVVDPRGCIGHDVITLTELEFTLTSTPADGCYGSTVLLEATGGTDYLWSTGETGNTIVVAPTITTNYSVQITNGICSETLSEAVSAVEPLEYELIDTLYIGAGETESLTGPEGFSSYAWYPTDQIDNPYGGTVIITGVSSDWLFVDATHSSGCTITDSVMIIVVDLAIPNGFSPNDDSFNDYFVVPQLYELDGAFTVWNRWGDIVYENEHYGNDWNGTCQGPLCAGNGTLPEGTYFYHITVDELTFKGFITLKR